MGVGGLWVSGNVSAAVFGVTAIAGSLRAGCLSDVHGPRDRSEVRTCRHDDPVRFYNDTGNHDCAVCRELHDRRRLNDFEFADGDR